MKSKFFIGILGLLLSSSFAFAGEWDFGAGGSAEMLYGYSDVARRYEKLDENNNTPSAVNLNLSAEYTFDNEDYRAGLYLDLMAGADKVNRDFNQGNWGEEAYGIFDTPYGRLMLGQTYNAAYQFGVGAPSVGPLGVNNSSIVNFINNPNWARDDKSATYRTLNSTYINTDGTAPKITYITPEFYNTMLGFTYVPDSYTRSGLINKYADYSDKDAYVFGLYNSFELNGVDVAASLGYAEFLDDDKEFSAGLSLSRGGWTLGGSWRKTYTDGSDYPQNVGYDRARTPELFDGYREGYAWNAGISYEIGPYQVGLSYFNAKADNSDNEDRIIQLSNQYQINKYVDVYLIAAHVDYKGSTDNINDNNKGYAFVTGIGINF